MKHRLKILSRPNKKGELWVSLERKIIIEEYRDTYWLSDGMHQVTHNELQNFIIELSEALKGKIPDDGISLDMRQAT